MEIRIKLLRSAKRCVPQVEKPNILDACKMWVYKVEECGVEEAKDAWGKIRRLQNKLMKVEKPSPLQCVLLRIMAPMVQKYGEMDPEGVDFDATYLNHGDSDA